MLNPTGVQGTKSGKELLTAVGDGAKLVTSKSKQRGAAGER